MGLFGDFDGANTSGVPKTDSSFAVLNRTAQPEYECLRKLLESWFEHFPDDGRGNLDLRKRFRSDKDRKHQAAFFELYISAMLRALPAYVEAHPTVDPTMTTAPDFLAHVSNGQGIIVECRIDSQSEAETSAHARLQQLIDELNALPSPSPDFIFMPDVRKVGRNTPSAVKILNFLQKRLENASVGDPLQKIIDESDVEEWVWESEDGWAIEFMPGLKSPDMKATENYPTIVRFSFGNIGGEFVLDGITSFRKALEAKTPSRYGRFALPYVLAVYVLNPFTQDAEIGEVLYGHRSYFGPRRREVSAVLVLRGISSMSPESIASSAPTLWHNPNAIYRLPEDLWPGPQAFGNDTSGSFEIRPGRSALEILGLGTDWPHSCN